MTPEEIKTKLHGELGKWAAYCYDANLVRYFTEAYKTIVDHTVDRTIELIDSPKPDPEPEPPKPVEGYRVGCTESEETPDHPEIRLANLAHRARNPRVDSITVKSAGTLGFPAGRYIVRAGSTTMAELELRGPEDALTYRGQRPENFSLRYEGHSSLFNPGFIENLSRFDVWRPLHLVGLTNKSQIENWEDRPQPGAAPGVYWEHGWPWEYAFYAAYDTDVIPWLTLPTYATDTYFEHFGELIGDRRCILEFSNECSWNYHSQQFTHEEYGKRAAEVYRVIGDRPNVEFVLSGQAGSPNMIRKALDGYDKASGPDLAIVSCSAYFNPNRLPDTSLYRFYSNGNDSLVFAACRDRIDELVPKWQEHAEIAKDLGCRFDAYECGQHLAAKPADRSDEDFIAWIDRICSDPRMGEVYGYLRDQMSVAGFTGANYHMRLARATRFGNWGHMRSADDTQSVRNVAVDLHIAETRPTDPTPEPPTPKPPTERGLVFQWSSDAIRTFSTVSGHAWSPDAIIIPWDLSAGINELEQGIVPIQNALTVCVEAKRVGLGSRESDKVGPCHILSFLSEPTPAYWEVHCDVGEPQWRAVRCRQGGIHNGSTSASNGLSKFTEGRWHHLTFIFSADGTKHYPNLLPVIDNNVPSRGGPPVIQSKVSGNPPQQDIRYGPGSLNWQYLAIGLGVPHSRTMTTLHIRNLRIYDYAMTLDQAAEVSESLGYFYGGANQ
jgi:hypothetical protein